MQAHHDRAWLLLRQTSVHTHDLIICFVQQATDFAVPLQHVPWNLQESILPQHTSTEVNPGTCSQAALAGPV